MADLLGQQFGNYRLIRLLGQGGFAEVYLGEHVRLGMKAAIKVLQTHLLTEQQIDAFQHEARTVAELTHPHIVRVLDFDLQDGRPFLVLDYAPNGSLQKKYPRGSCVPLDQVVSYVQQVASALDYAHTHKLIHRDVKPENLLIGKQGEILLSDFGIVTLAHATSSMNTEAALGTLAYMAPEQIQGKPRKESDQYALAVAVYHWLSGRLPFEGSSAEVIAQHLGAPPPPLRTSLPELPAEVESVVLTALAKDPAQRFGSVQAFARALTVASGKAPVSSPLALEAQVQPPEPVSDATTTQQAGAAVVAAVPEGSSTPPAPPASTTTPVLPLPPTVPVSLPEQQPVSRKKQVYTITLVSLAVLLILSYIVTLDVSQMHVASVKATATSDAQNAQSTITTGANILATTGAHVQATATADVLAAATANVLATAQTVAQNPYPSYMPGKGTLVLLEPLNEEKPWSGQEDSSYGGTCQLQNDGLHVSLLNNSQSIFRCDNSNRVFGNFTLEVQVVIVFGNCGGVGIRGGNNQEYGLYICSDGIYRIDRNDDATSNVVLTYGSSSWINTGYEPKNTLGIVANGPTMQLYVNGHLIASATDGKYSRGSIGLLALDAGDSTEVAYTNMRVWV